MNTTALRTNAVLARNSSAAAMGKEVLLGAARDFLASLLSITKSTVLSQQSTRPRMRRF